MLNACVKTVGGAMVWVGTKRGDYAHRMLKFGWLCKSDLVFAHIYHRLSLFFTPLKIGLLPLFGVDLSLLYPSLTMNTKRIIY